MAKNGKKARGVRKAFKSLPEDLQEALGELIERAENEEEFVRFSMVGNCPSCGSPNTRDTEGTPLDDITVGICLDCYKLWCLECGAVFEEGQTSCKHWEVCSECNLTWEEDIGNGETIPHCDYDANYGDCPTLIRQKKQWNR